MTEPVWKRAVETLQRKVADAQHAQQAQAANEALQELIYAQRKAKVEATYGKADSEGNDEVDRR